MRLFRLLPLMLFLLLCGCQGGDSAAGSLPDLDKAQEVRVIPAGETAPTTAPMTAASRVDTPISRGASSTIPSTSRPAGRKHSSRAGLPCFFPQSIVS